MYDGSDKHRECRKHRLMYDGSDKHFLIYEIINIFLKFGVCTNFFNKCVLFMTQLEYLNVMDHVLICVCQILSDSES